MRIKALIILFLIVLLSFSVFAANSWQREGNSGEFGRGLMGSYKQTINYTENYKVSQCSQTSFFEPTYHDFDNDGSAEIVLANSNGIVLINEQCDIVSIYPVQARFMPEITNLDANSDYEITYMDINKNVLILKLYGGSLTQFANITLSPNNTYNQGMACGKTGVLKDVYLRYKCFFISTGYEGTSTFYTIQTNYTMLNFYSYGLTTPTESTYYFYDNSTTAIYPFEYNGTSYNDISISFDEDSTWAYIPVITHHTSNAETKMRLFDTIGNSTAFFNWTTSAPHSLSNLQNNMVNYQAAIVNINGYDRIVVNFAAGQVTSSNIVRSGLHTLTGVQKYIATAYGNFMINDFLKSGYNKLFWYQSSTPALLYSMNEEGTIIGTYNISPGTLADSRNMVLGDFCDTGNASYLGMATPQGILCTSNTNVSFNILNDSSYGTPAASCTVGNKGASDNNICMPGIIVNKEYTNTPYYIWPAYSGLVIYHDTMTSTYCGDGVCDAGESAFSCAIDCQNATSNISSTCLDASPGYICKASCSSGYTVLSDYNCNSVDPAFVCCAPSSTQGCSLSNYAACPQLNATCTTNGTGGSSDYLCNNPFIINDTIYCASAPYSCVANGFAGCAYGECYLSSCLADADCSPPYTTCLQGTCVSGYNASLLCGENSDCASGICFNSHCVSGVAGGVTGQPQINEDDLASSNVETSVTALMNVLFGGQSWLKLIVGLIIVILVAVQASKLAGGNPFVTSIGAFVGAIISTILGLIPSFILILVIVMLILLLIFSRVLFPNVGETR